MEKFQMNILTFVLYQCLKKKKFNNENNTEDKKISTQWYTKSSKNKGKVSVFTY